MARRSLEDQLAALAEATSEPTSEAAARELRAALGNKTSFVVAQAARVVRDHSLDGFGAALEDALERFYEDSIKRDPGCHAKLALLEALDATDHLAHAPFERAASHVQLEPSWGRSEDTAAALRARALLALARSAYPDLVLLAGARLADPEPPVRRAALVALSVHGDRAGAGLARFKIALGDDDPLVTAEAMCTLLALAPDVAVPELTELVRGDDPARRELALIALGESKRSDALGPLLDHLEASVLAAERKTVFTALALHRSEPALRVLLVWVSAHESDAAAALEALALRRYEADVLERVREAASTHGRETLFHEAFRIDDQSRGHSEGDE